MSISALLSLAGVVEPEVGLSAFADRFPPGRLVGLDDSAQLTISSIGTDDLEPGPTVIRSPRVASFHSAWPTTTAPGQVLTPGSDCTVDVTFPSHPGVVSSMPICWSHPMPPWTPPAEVAVSGAGVGSGTGDCAQARSTSAMFPVPVITVRRLGQPEQRGRCTAGNHRYAMSRHRLGWLPAPDFAWMVVRRRWNPTESCTLTFEFTPAAIVNAAQTVTEPPIVWVETQALR